ncbi:hypothetical protein DL96DRAFT_1625161 [Flagelloscypha sp. PMI_526]|nr:hypothetical protein DL96DRAFT_1625161 [Flagelloscypha sp. PMI_526]
MPTPKAGTIRQQDLEILPRRSKNDWRSQYLVPTLWLTLFTGAFCGYNVAACALGRFLLDHFHLWKRTIPSDTPSIEKHAELIAAFVAGFLATPTAFGFFSALTWVDKELMRRKVKYQFLLQSYASFWAEVFMVDLVAVTVTGAIFHSRFRQMGAVSILAVFGFGSLLLVPAVGFVVGVIWVSWDLWRKWRKM